MEETSRARDELDRLGRSLRRQLVALITDLTVRVHLRRLSLDEPKVADRREPPRYHYATVYQGNRPAAATAAETASRATFLLRSAGWDVTESEEDDDGVLWRVVDAHQDGNAIRILTSDNTPAVSFRGQTPALALCPPKPVQQPEPVRTAEAITPGYVLCYECDGLGWCPGCGGRGWVLGQPHRRSRCRECGTTKVCPICRGAGQLNASSLSPYQRGYYPGLDRG
ncbi:hypothetical protein LVX13_25560 [Streptomyces albulus]|uniref:hypothetical protein n=1 Tax=Streptomyces noursei TaxID=1971 RepID=UPI001F24FC1F|nr:hypothetical protein [Streptomyces noursei]MCE4946466.1 hypothetical protein [Streptomyces noursei]